MLADRWRNAIRARKEKRDSSSYKLIVFEIIAARVCMCKRILQNDRC